jgi:hypothetical protein
VIAPSSFTTRRAPQYYAFKQFSAACEPSGKDEPSLNRMYKFRSESEAQVSRKRNDLTVHARRGSKMKIILLTCSAFASLVVVTPAMALTPANPAPTVKESTLDKDAGCVLTTMTEASQTAIMAAFVDKKSDNNDLMTKATQGAVDAAQTCKTDQHWSELRSDHAYGLAVTTLLYQAAVDQAKSAGIDPDAVESWFGGQDEPFRTTYATDHMAPNRYDTETERMISELDLEAIGNGKAGQQKLDAVATLVATLVLVTRASMALNI